jgi:hypothetical protein
MCSKSKVLILDYKHARARTRTHKHTRAQTHAPKHARAHTNTHARTQTRAYTQTRTHTNARTHKHARTRTHKRARTHTNTRAHTNTHAHAHTNARTHTKFPNHATILKSQLSQVKICTITTSTWSNINVTRNNSGNFLATPHGLVPKRPQPRSTGCKNWFWPNACPRWVKHKRVYNKHVSYSKQNFTYRTEHTAWG